MRLRVIHQHSPFCPILARFMGYYSPFWCPCAISLLVELQGPITCLRAGHRHSPFWLIRPVSWAIAHLFEVLERFPRLMIPEVRLRVGHQHLQFWPILAHFVDYYSPF